MLIPAHIFDGDYLGGITGAFNKKRKATQSVETPPAKGKVNRKQPIILADRPRTGQKRVP